ncbi:MAG: EamA family transporter [Clostridia bacterium]|nr:EamA family transporter [Clostridia bacterium]MBQ8743530.1 EamA family transporter [Clostridia bacterium]
MKAFSPVFAILAGLFWGISGVFSNILHAYGLTSFQISGARGIVASVFLIMTVLIFKRRALFTDLKTLLLFIFGGLAIFGTSTCYFTSMRYVGVSTAVVLMYTAPVLVMAFSVIFLKEKLTPKKLMCLISMLLGCVLVSGIFSSGRFDPIGIIWGTASGICYAAYNIIAKIEASRGKDSLNASVYHFSVMGIAGIFLLDPPSFSKILSVSPLKISLLLIAVGLFTCVIPYMLFSLALKYLPVGTASALSITEPLSATVIAIVFLGEKATLISASGILMILIPCILLSLSKEETK